MVTKNDEEDGAGERDGAMCGKERRARRKGKSARQSGDEARGVQGEGQLGSSTLPAVDHSSCKRIDWVQSRAVHAWACMCV